MTTEPSDIERFTAQRADAPLEKLPLSDHDRDVLLELYGVSRDVWEGFVHERATPVVPPIGQATIDFGETAT